MLDMTVLVHYLRRIVVIDGIKQGEFEGEI
jgi:hypothetical protein